MTRWNSLQAIAVLLCIAAGYISYNLLQKHITGSSGVAWFESVCEDRVEKSSVGCDVVLASPYAYWPPKTDPDSRRLHVPVAFLGLAYYSVLGVWLFGVGRPSVDRRWIHILPLALIVFGLISSAYFLFVMFTKFEQWCPWCLITHIINLFVAAAVLLLFPKEARGEADEHAKQQEKTPGAEEIAGTPTPASRPSARLACTTLLAMMLVLFAEYQMHGLQATSRREVFWRSKYNGLAKYVMRLQQSGRALLVDWEDGASCDIDIRDDDPIHIPNTAAGPHWTVVVFSDFECPGCRSFASFLEHKVQPLFDGRLRVIFKHYPLDPKCNSRVRLPTHPHACNAARIAEGARLIGGSDAFWRAHDYLFSHRDTIHAGSMTPDAVAQAINVDPARLREAMSSAEIRIRIDGDVAQAAHCGLTGTPGVFVNGKKVDAKLTVVAINFWDKLADMLWEQSGTPRPDHTRRPDPNEATPGIPVPVTDR